MKVGVIGHLGSIGSRHAKNLKHLGHEVIGYDANQSIVWPEAPYAALDDIWNHADAVVIASPTSTHYDYIKKCDGKPTFVEKPIHDKVLAGVRNDIDFNSVVMVGYNLRFHSCVIKAKEWIDAGMLGAPLWGNFVVAQKNTKYTDHVILNWSHEIDLTLYLLGSARVKACAGHSQIADIILYHKSHTSTVHLDYLTAPEIRQSIIVGEKSTIIMDLLGRQAWLRNPEGLMIDSFIGNDSWESNYLDEMETFIARVEGKETIGCSGQEGLEVLKICLEAKRLSQ